MYEIRECTNPACQLRFPMQRGQRPGEQCPGCNHPTILQSTVAVEREAERAGEPAGAPSIRASTLVAPALAVLLDNIRSSFNVGSIVRSADGAAFRQIFFCGITPTPTNPKVAKTALGAEQAVAWSQHNNSLACATALRARGYQLWALEEHATAVSLFATPMPAGPLLLIVGNEVTGVDPALLALCDRIVAIPMYGRKRSLNVATAFGSAATILAERRFGNSI